MGDFTRTVFKVFEGSLLNLSMQKLYVRRSNKWSQTIYVRDEKGNQYPKSINKQTLQQVNPIELLTCNNSRERTTRRY